jgi:hypothetical protein
VLSEAHYRELVAEAGGAYIAWQETKKNFDLVNFKIYAFAYCHSGRFLAGIQLCNMLKSWMPR